MHEEGDENSEDQQWQLIEEHFRNGRPLGGQVIKATRERLFIDIGGIQGTVEHPTRAYTFSTDTESHLSPEELFERSLEQMKGKTIPLKVIEVDRTRNHLLLSQHLYTEEELLARRLREAQLLQEIQLGDIRKGIVISLTRSMVSVDLEGVDGWMPRHFLSLQNHRIDPHDVLHIGQEIEVMVLENDRRRVTLSLIHAQQRDVVLQTMQLGQILTARIHALSHGGAYVDLGGPLGFISANQIVHGYITHPADVLHRSQEVVVRIERIDDNKRVMLSLIETR